MRNGWRFLFGLCSITILDCFIPGASAHFGILVPEQAGVRKGEPVPLRYYNGHPFECQLAETQAPQAAQVLAPDGKTRTDLKAEPKQMSNAEGGKVTIQTMSFTPAERGDHWVLVSSPLRFDEHAGGFVQDELKVLVRTQVSKGWDNATGQSIELLPLNRPYGLKPGSAFKAQVRLNGKLLADAIVEIERLNLSPPKTVPEDDALVTQAAKTDINGYVICTLDEPGWWGLMVTAQDGTKEKDGKTWPIIRRGILWVHVEEPQK